VNGLWIGALALISTLVLLLAVLVLGVLRRVAPVLERAEAALVSGQVSLGSARPGMRIESFEALDSRGEAVDSDRLFDEPGVFVVMHSGCGPCRQLSERLRDMPALRVPLVVLLDDSPAARKIPIPQHARQLFDHDGGAAAAFRGGGTPQAFALTAGGVLVETLVPGSAEDLKRLAELATEGGGSRRDTTTEVAHVV
jgi:hypothetical protein